MAERMSPQDKRHPIRVAASRAGLTPSVVRVWESRYGAIEPGRTGSGQRRYSDRDVERLRLLQEATAAGRRIGDVATLADARLRALVDEDRREARRASEEWFGANGSGAREILAATIEAVEASDVQRLRRELDRAVLGLTPVQLVEAVTSPLMERVGEMWAEGRLDPAHEHLATVVIRQVLTEAVLGTEGADPDRRIVIGTPAGQRHEIGALEAAVCAAGEGWGVVYLGTDLPAASIATAVLESRARAIALSIVYPRIEAPLLDDLSALRSTIDPAIVFLAGGQAALDARRELEALGIRILEGLAGLPETLAALNGANAT